MSVAGLSILALLKAAPDSAVQELIEPSVRELLAAVDPGSLEGQRLRDLVRTLWTSAELIRDDAQRTRLIALLPPEKASELAQALGAKHPSGISKALETFNLNSHHAQEVLARFFGAVVPGTNAISSRPSISVVSGSYGLFPHQRLAVQDVQIALSKQPGRVVLHLPTGAGKTRVAMHVLCEHLRAHDPGVVIWLAYNRELLEQAASAFESAWGSLGNRDLTVVRYWSDVDVDLAEIRDGLIVAGLGKLDAATRRDYQMIVRLADHVTLTVMDEAHQSIARTYSQLLDLFATKRLDAGLLGLTATPGRTWSDIDADAELAAFYRHQKVTLRPEGYSNPVTFLIENGYLARPIFTTLNVEPGLSLTNVDRRELSANLDIPDEILHRLAENQQRNLRVLDAIENLLKRHRRVIIFATTVGHARLIATVLRSRSYAAEAITANTSWVDRESAIQRFRSNSSAPMALCNYGVLTAGFDAPATSAVLIARPTRSLVLYSQMVGRAIRGPKAGGNHQAEILTVIDPELPGFGEITEAFTNWEDVWT